MPKRKKGFLEMAGHALARGVANRVHDEADRFMETARRHVLVLEERMLDRLVTAILGVAAALLFAAALVLLLVDETQLNRWQALGVCAIGLLAVAYWRKYRTQRD